MKKIFIIVGIVIGIGILIFAPIYKVPGSKKVTCICFVMGPCPMCEEWEYENLISKINKNI